MFAEERIQAILNILKKKVELLSKSSVLNLMLQKIV